ncbi:twin-arginine translocase subunit TatB [Sphingorhabdus soli]|uniref:Sec-independent protein translocase protein TatB n=1 Tax=Flavisphingopyxis soli TaxID=2601267 RepID=A0A5C6UAJ5_9SPHN|nr:Sec-independent protein translocase protein TatB [Sphingorhabdus soli]TXC68718.1 twin-arginine translocase subunit TatB [Sphingorhabdus soli]
MFDIGSTELLMVAVVALVVIGPKDLPKAMRVVGHWVGKARGFARQMRAGFDDIVRESELAELEKKWAEENARIMREFPSTGDTVEMQPLAPPAATTADEPLLPGIDESKASPDDASPGTDERGSAQ